MTRTAGHATPAPPEGRARREFPPTARKLLVAARRVLVRNGYPGLTMQAIERESGINRALIH
ncbi:MAG TPA: helix-turn-helix domain-containing protein, partial [Thermoleophilia bacterium]|nr:helix-turn-helix domain-containing protein [Thermoleophilia bacterium]